MKKRKSNESSNPASYIEIGLLELAETEPDYPAWEKRLRSKFQSASLNPVMIWKSLPTFMDPKNPQLISKWHDIEANRVASAPPGAAEKTGNDAYDNEYSPHDTSEVNAILDWISRHPIFSISAAGLLSGWIASPFGWFFPIFFSLTLVLLLVRAYKKRTLGRGLYAAFFAISFITSGIVHDLFFVNLPIAECRDGSYSYSTHHQGTCSWHGGVAEWNPPAPSHWWQE